MKNIFIILFSTIATCVFSQVAIGKPSVTNSWVSLDFGDGNKGLLLPWVTSAASVTGAVDGVKIVVTDFKSVIFALIDTSKAMILPKVEKPQFNIINPSAGMIDYDIRSNSLQYLIVKNDHFGNLNL